MIRKKSLTVFIVLFFCVCSILIGCKNTPQENKLLYEINSDSVTCTITGIGDYEGDEIVIPEKIGEYTVTAIADKAFNSSNIKTVFMPATVIEIGEKAFADCYNLEYVVGLDTSSSLESIGNGAFFACRSLQEITIPSTVTYIGIEAFGYCINLKNVSFAKSNRDLRISEYAFFGCYSLTSITLPKQCSSLGFLAFSQTSIENIYVDPNHSFCKSIDGVLFADIDGVGIGAYPCSKNDYSYEIPFGTIWIEPGAFGFNEFIHELYIPKSVSYIYGGILYNSPNLTTIRYRGTIEEWDSINKYSNWDEGSPEYTIYCTDGQISKDGTVTYN